MNVILHSLAHVCPLKDYLLRPENYSGIKRPPGDQTFNLGKGGGENREGEGRRGWGEEGRERRRDVEGKVSESNNR